MLRKELVILLALMLLVACSQPVPETEAPSSTPLPKPTSTSQPTNTPPPTPTQETLSTPEPVIYEGSGDTMLPITKPIEGDMCFLYVKGNTIGEFFGMVAYGTDDNLLHKLIVTEEPYEGIRLLDGSPEKNTAMLEIRAVGPWQIKLIPVIQPYMAEYIIDVPGEFSGNGDVVVLTRGQSSSITGNYTGDKHFVIFAHGTKTGGLVFNEQGIFTGDGLLPENTVMLEIMSEGDWEIEIK